MGGTQSVLDLSINLYLLIKITMQFETTLVTKITMSVNLVVGSQHLLFLDLLATLNTAYRWLSEMLSYLISKVPYPLVFSQPQQPFSLNLLPGSSSSNCSLNVGVSQGSVFASFLYLYSIASRSSNINQIILMLR